MYLVLFIKLCFILSFVNYLRCGEFVKSESISADRAVTSDTKPEKQRSVSGYVIILIIIFITVVCTLSVIALLYGFQRGRESVRRESQKEEQNEDNLNSQENDSKKPSAKVSNVRQNNVNTETNATQGSKISQNDSEETIRSKSDEEMGAEVRDKQNLSL